MDDKITVQRDGESLRIRIPMRFKKRGGRKEIIMPEGLSQHLADRSVYQKPLVSALIRAHQWKRVLDDGRIPSITALAKRLKVDRAYVSRLLHLTLLAPDIIEAILYGREPSGLSLARLNKAFPLEWNQQRVALGFESAPQRT